MFRSCSGHFLSPHFLSFFSDVSSPPFLSSVRRDFQGVVCEHPRMAQGGGDLLHTTGRHPPSDWKQDWLGKRSCFVRFPLICLRVCGCGSLLLASIGVIQERGVFAQLLTLSDESFRVGPRPRGITRWRSAIRKGSFHAFYGMQCENCRGDPECLWGGRWQGNIYLYIHFSFLPLDLIGFEHDTFFLPIPLDLQCTFSNQSFTFYLFITASRCSIVPPSFRVTLNRGDWIWITTKKNRKPSLVVDAASLVSPSWIVYMQ